MDLNPNAEFSLTFPTMQNTDVSLTFPEMTQDHCMVTPLSGIRLLQKFLDSFLIMILINLDVERVINCSRVGLMAG